METKDELQVMDHLAIPTTTTGTSFSQLLLGADDDNDNPLGLDVDQTFSTSLFSLHNTPKMLCFGDYQNEIDETTNVILTPQKSIITSSDSSSASSCNHQTNTGFNSLTTTKSNVCVCLFIYLFKNDVGVDCFYILSLSQSLFFY